MPAGMRRPAGRSPGAAAAAAGDAEMDRALLEFINVALEDLDHCQIMALVKNLKSKKGKGRGKGGPRKCYECDAEDHIASACPVRAERINNGGPERLGKPDIEMGKGKGGGKGSKANGQGKNQYHPKRHWKDFNDPSVIQNPQWMRWHPANKPQLKSLVTDENWWNTPGNFLSISRLSRRVLRRS